MAKGKMKRRKEHKEIEINNEINMKDIKVEKAENKYKNVVKQTLKIMNLTLFSILYFIVASTFQVYTGGDVFSILGVMATSLTLAAFELQDYKQNIGIYLLLAGELITMIFTGNAIYVIMIVTAAIILMYIAINKHVNMFNVKNNQFKTKWTYKLLFYCTAFAYVAYQHNWLITNYINDGTIDMSIAATLYNTLPFAIIFAYITFLDVFRPIYCVYSIALVILTLQTLSNTNPVYSLVIYTVCSTLIYLKIQSRGTKNRLSMDLDKFVPIKIKQQVKDENKE